MQGGECRPAIKGISREKAAAVAKLPPSLKSFGATRWRTGWRDKEQRNFHAYAVEWEESSRRDADWCDRRNNTRVGPPRETRQAIARSVTVALPGTRKMSVKRIGMETSLWHTGGITRLFEDFRDVATRDNGMGRGMRRYCWRAARNGSRGLNCGPVQSTGLAEKRCPPSPKLPPSLATARPDGAASRGRNSMDAA
jgi:hypothetical protein